MDSLITIYIFAIIIFGSAVIIYDSIKYIYRNYSCFHGKKDWNGGICPRCGKRYKFESVGSDHHLFSCDCSPSGKVEYYLFRKGLTYDIVRCITLSGYIEEYDSKALNHLAKYHIPLDTKLERRVRKFREEKKKILNKKKNRAWRDIINEI